MGCIYASVSYSFVTDAAVYGTLNNPTADYLESVGTARPSLTVSADINPLGIRTGNLQFSVGASVFANSRTPTYHNQYLKGFNSYGPNIKVLYDFPSSKISASLRTRLLFCTLNNSHDEFAAFSAEASVLYHIGNRGSYSVFVPINLTIRKDILGISGGIGFNVDITKLFSKAGR